MADDSTAKPDFAKGVALSDIPDGGILGGVVGEQPVLLTRSGDTVRAFGGKCTHLGAPLADGLVVDGEIRCPWHHACFSLTSGEATAAPAFDPLPCWSVERQGDRVIVAKEAPKGQEQRRAEAAQGDAGMVIIGGGAAGYAAAHELRQRGYPGAITMVSAEPHEPYDRTLLTKDYLDGKFGDDHLPIAKASLADLGVTFLGETRIESIDPAGHRIVTADGQSLPYAKLLLATGAEPNRLDVPGADLPHVNTLRTLDDVRAILADLAPETRIAVIGSSFIGLEAAASLRTRGCAVTVVTPETTPMAKVLGPALSDAIVSVHKGKGVAFKLNAKVAAITESAVRLENGDETDADLVVLGIGVKPRLDLAQAAGLEVNDGIVVDATLRTSDPDIYAVGDIAAWPDPASSERIRVEHWAVAERQAQTAARNMLGGSEPYDVVPFFWSKHFDFSFRYVGHAEAWDKAVVEGDLASKKAVVRYRKAGRDLAVATVGQDLQALKIERDMEAAVSSPA